MSSRVQRTNEYGEVDRIDLFPVQEPLIHEATTQPIAGSIGTRQWYEAQALAAVEAECRDMAIQPPDTAAARRVDLLKLHLRLPYVSGTLSALAVMSPADCAAMRDELAALHHDASRVMAAVERLHGQVPLTTYLRYIRPGDVASFEAARAETMTREAA